MPSIHEEMEKKLRGLDSSTDKGRITWKDKTGKVVASGRCAAILSEESPSEYLLASAITMYEMLEIPYVDIDDGLPQRVYPARPGDARTRALSLGERAGAKFVYYRKKQGEWLAIMEFSEAAAKKPAAKKPAAKKPAAKKPAAKKPAAKKPAAKKPAAKKPAAKKKLARK